MPVDPGRAWINRHVTVPVVSYDWSSWTDPDDGELVEDFGSMVKANRNPNGLIGEWRKVRERIVARRSRALTDSPVWRACEEAIGLVRRINKLGEAGRLGMPGDWVPSHTILDRAATLHERRTGRIDPLVQAVLRDAMDEVYLKERVE